jgi:hypothetical protein
VVVARDVDGVDAVHDGRDLVRIGALVRQLLAPAGRPGIEGFRLRDETLRARLVAAEQGAASARKEEM